MKFESKTSGKNMAATIYRFDHDVLKEMCRTLKKGNYQISRMSDSRIVGIADCDPNNLGYGGEAGLLCFSIPYDEGWHVMVDGVETETMRVFGGALVGVSVPKGTHTITLEYWPLGLTTGITVSIFSLILLLFLVKPGCRKKRLPDPV